jgi:hypothetical protein
VDLDLEAQNELLFAHDTSIHEPSSVVNNLQKSSESQEN